ncbi:hypothetical protein QFZ99_001127 [Paraburkholderia atlantica]
MAIFRTGLDQQHRMAPAFRKTIGQHATCGTGANHDKVKLDHLCVLHRPCMQTSATYLVSWPAARA